MADKLNARPTAATYQLEDLVSMVRSGQVRVPYFQRDFRWGREDVRRLFDSILKGYPIGSLLLWERPAEAKKLRLGALEIDAPEQDRALWVVDGQQRIISLVNAVNEEGQQDDRFALSYDLRNGEFVNPTAAGTKTNGLVIPLPVLFDLEKLLAWFVEHPEINQHVNEANSVTSTLRQYPISANQVKQEDPKVLRDIFDRMNNYGKRLKRAEIFAALNAVDQQVDSEALTFELISEHIDTDRKFGRIDSDTVLKGVLARRAPNVLREIRNEFDADETEGREAAYREGERALTQAVTFLQEEAQVPHFGFLAYRYLLVVLARFFALHPTTSDRDRQLLRRWYWRAALVGPGAFKGAQTGAIRSLCNQVNGDDLTGSIQGLLKAVGDTAPQLPDLRRFRANQATTKLALCSWWAAEPRDPHTAEVYDQRQLARCLDERQTAREALQYLLSDSTMSRDERAQAANRVLMPTTEDSSGDEVELLLNDTVHAERPQDWDAVLRSHALTPEAVSLARDGKFDAFIETRKEILQQRLRVFLTQNCEWGMENTPSLSELVIADEDEADDEALDRPAGGDFLLGG